MKIANGIVIFSAIILHCVLFCTASDTITINKPIRDGETLISKENKFALGFFTPGKSNYRYVGIWYYNLEEKTVVWVSNRDNPINDTSGILSISSDGNLVLHGNFSNMPIWSTNVSVTVPNTRVMAHLTDLGNLVLVQNDSKTIIWQSFDHPTDTLLPYARIGVNKKTGQKWYLQAWKTDDDPGTGSFSVRLNTSGKAQMFAYKKNTPVWRAGSYNGEIFVGIPFMKRATATDYSINVTDNDNEVGFIFYAFDNKIIMRVVALQAGFFQTLLWDYDKKQWNRFWSAQQVDCDNYGSCGANGNCDPLNYANFKCSCLPGFEPRNPTNWYQHGDATEGCVRKKGPSLCGNEEGFVRVKSVKIPHTSIVNANMEMSLEECERECLRNCSCKAYAAADVRNAGSGCLTWYGILMDTQILSQEGHDLFVRVDAIELAKYARKSKTALAKSGKVGIATACVTLITLLIALFAYCFWNRKRRDEIAEQELKLNSPTEEEDGENSAQPSLPFFSIKTIMIATNNFSNENQLGQGGFGCVYKGILVNGQEIAVKRLSEGSGQGTQEFMNEIKLIAKLQHRNLVKLLGYCIHKEEKILIYEYLPNKSLNFFLFDSNQRISLDWDKCIHIIFGIARGLLYLHQDSRLKIIHRNLKASNVLLDATMNPKISDFGMARIFGEDQIQVWDLWREEKALEIVDSTLGESYPLDIALRCIQIGLLCVQESASYRPSMLEAIFMLGNEVSIPYPKKPAFLFTSDIEHLESPASGDSSVNNVSNTTISAR